jgi:hypothetical protein
MYIYPIRLLSQDHPNTALIMRLLRIEAGGEFSQVEFVGQDIPRYAILSHTWGADADEVTFEDIQNGAGREKPGFNKISFCGTQAAKDGLEFFWVDTCCINKSSSAELSEAINSMFRWYQKAAKCYALLTDLSISSPIQDSKWFTRSWTLQELLAPKSVEFFSADGTSMGNRSSLEQAIHEITGISIRALQGNSLAQFGIAERISWAEERVAKREEDTAYSLLGFFDISMPVIYGEGREKALFRLRREIEHSSPTRQPTRSMKEGQTSRTTSSSFHNYGPGSRVVNNYGGTQYNITGSGNVFTGNINGPIRFG